MRSRHVIHGYKGEGSGVDLTNTASAHCGYYTGCVAVKNNGTKEARGYSALEGGASTSTEGSTDFAIVMD